MGHIPVSRCWRTAVLALVAVIGSCAALSVKSNADLGRKPTSLLRRSEHGFYEAVLPKTGRKHHSSQLLVHYSAANPSNWTLLCTWYTVTPMHMFGIMISRLPRGSQRWSEPEKVTVKVGYSLQNPVWMWGGPDDDIIRIFYTASRRGVGTESGELMRIQSIDGGESWGEPQLVEFQNGSKVAGTFIRNRPLQGPGHGQWIMPMYYTPEGLSNKDVQYSELRVSDDGGRSWAPGIPLSPVGMGLVQPTIVHLKKPVRGEPRMVAFFRNRFKEGIWQSESWDGGWTWGEPKATDLPSNNKAIQAIVLQSGNLALVFNNRGGGTDLDKGNMYPMTIALSEDDGKTWKYVRDLDYDYPRPELDFTYPSVVQTEDGMLHVSHTWSRTRGREGIRYLTFDEAWIKKGYSWGSTRGVYRPPSQSCIWIFIRGNHHGNGTHAVSHGKSVAAKGSWKCITPE